MKVVAANMVRSDRSLSGTHLLCSVGRYQEACSQVRFCLKLFRENLNEASDPKICLMCESLQLQDAGCWTDSATLAATHLNGSDYARCVV